MISIEKEYVKIYDIVELTAPILQKYYICKGRRKNYLCTMYFNLHITIQADKTKNSSFFLFHLDISLGQILPLDHTLIFQYLLLLANN
jgi:hypothetical protein